MKSKDAMIQEGFYWKGRYDEAVVHGTMVEQQVAGLGWSCLSAAFFGRYVGGIKRRPDEPKKNDYD